MSTKQMSFRCSEALHAETATVARDLGMSKSDFMRLAVERYLVEMKAELEEPVVREIENVSLSELAVTVVAEYVDEPVYMAVPIKEVVAPEPVPATDDAAMMELLINSGLLPMDNATANKFYGLLGDIDGYGKLVKKYKYGFINPKSVKMPTPELIEAKKDAENKLCVALSTLMSLTVPHKQTVELIEAVLLHAPCLPETMAKNLIKQARAKYDRALLKGAAKGLTQRGYVLDKLNQIVIALNSEGKL